MILHLCFAPEDLCQNLPRNTDFNLSQSQPDIKYVESAAGSDTT